MCVLSTIPKRFVLIGERSKHVSRFMLVRWRLFGNWSLDHTFRSCLQYVEILTGNILMILFHTLLCERIPVLQVVKIEVSVLESLSDMDESSPWEM